MAPSHGQYRYAPFSFSPQAGQTFDFFHWGSLTDTFDYLNLPDLGEELYWDTGELYATGALAVKAVPEASTGLLFGVGLVGFVAWRRRTA